MRCYILCSAESYAHLVKMELVKSNLHDNIGYVYNGACNDRQRCS